MNVLVTGSNGLVGCEVAALFVGRGADVVGIDSNARKSFFGEAGDTESNRGRACVAVRVDIRDRGALDRAVSDEGPFDLVVHCAAQPSHDLSARRPLDDFDTNALGTVNLLESVRQHSPGAVFVHLSTSKVYGDAPNELSLVEGETRFECIERPEGIDESMRIDCSMHSPFGASKAGADLMVQEYGRYYGMRTVCLRPGCLTGRWHAGVELHGFLSYLVKCVATTTTYNIYGYKGKQVRDNLDGYDVATAIEAIWKNPPTPGEVFNLGGGKENSVSILEALDIASRSVGMEAHTRYTSDARKGDHQWYVSDMRKFRSAYPGWRVTKDVPAIIGEIAEEWQCNPTK